MAGKIGGYDGAHARQVARMDMGREPAPTSDFEWIDVDSQAEADAKNQARPPGDKRLYREKHRSRDPLAEAWVGNSHGQAIYDIGE